MTREDEAREVLHRQGVRISQTMLNDAVVRAMLTFAATREAVVRAEEREAAARVVYHAIQPTLDGYASGTPKQATGDNAIRSSAMLHAANLAASAIRNQGASNG